MEFGGGGFFKTFLEGSVDHIIYRNDLVNRRSFIYCSLACSVQQQSERPVDSEQYQNEYWHTYTDDERCQLRLNMRQSTFIWPDYSR